MSAAGLNAAVEPVDTAHMIETELDLLRENPSWLAVLQAYVAVFEDLAAGDASAGDSAADDTATDDTATVDSGDLQPGSAPDSDQAADSDLDSVDSIDGTSDADSEHSEGTAPQKSRRRQPWAPRLTSVASVDSDELSRIHGRLIAYGLLKCDLADRTAGVVYQLTIEARRALAALPEEDAIVASDGGEISRSA